MATDPGFAIDIKAWCERTGNQLLSLSSEAGKFTARIRKGQMPTAAAQAGRTVTNDKTIVLFSGDFDKAMAAFIIATTAASMGGKVTIFFTFWGLNLLRRHKKVRVRKTLIERMFGLMMPRGSKKFTLSRMNMGGMGTRMIKRIMRKKQVPSLEELIKAARDSGIQLVACQMTMELMGIKSEELIDGVEKGGAASYIGAADTANTNLFI
jgi:peroxiredoxin family protein